LILLYTTVEGGHWIPFNTPLSPLELGRVTAIAARGSRDFPAIFHDEDGFDRLYPDGDTLPRFHSILTSEGRRWDATNQRWESYDVNGLFREWFTNYVANYRPFELDGERKFGWRDQEPSLSYRAATTDGTF
jgi:hypothetical protein